MTIEEAKALLAECTREELRDHAFGDAEVYWSREGEEEDVAVGYFGNESREVVFEAARFNGPGADELRYCGKRGRVERNDTTGPDEYREGVTMSGLTLEGVRKELEGEE